MGGNLFNNTRRYRKEEYLKLSNEICWKTVFVFKGLVNIVPSVFNKESYGDIDILIELKEGENPREILQNTFGAENIIHNGNCYSLVVDELQCDFIISNESEYLFHIGYLSWNDAGMLIGVVARKFGLRFKHNGLFYPVYDGPNKIQELLVTDDFGLALNILGFNSTRHLAGFKTFEDLYQWIVDSKYFHPEMFKFESLNHTNKKRNSKRPGWFNFQDFIDDENYKNWGDNCINIGRWNIKEFLSKSGIFKKAGVILSERARQQAAREKMLKLFKETLPELQGKELGAAIVKFKESIDFVKYIEDSNENDIILRIKLCCD